MKELNDIEKRLADMQDLCRRAHLILSENWDNYTEDGYGPTSLLRHLELAGKGKELGGVTSMNNELVRICNKQADELSKADLNDNEVGSHKWRWMMEYCLKKGIPVAQGWAWDKAERAYSNRKG